VLSDGGGIYCLGLQQHATLSDNHVFNAHTGWGGCYYLDQGSTYWSMFENVARHDGALYWLFLNNSENDYAYTNYTDLDSVYLTYGNYTGPLIETNTVVVSDANWPASAQAIINSAGPDFTTYYTSDINSILIGENIGNGTFAQGLNGWTVGGATQTIRNGVAAGIYSDDSTPAGTNSVAFNVGNQSPGATLSTTFTESAGHSYALFYSQATEGANTFQNLSADILESNGNDVSLGTSSTWVSGQYSRYVRTFAATTSGTAKLQFTDSTSTGNVNASDSSLTRVELRDVTAPGYFGPVEGNLLLSDDFNSGNSSAAGFNTTLSADQQGSLAPLTYSVTTAGQDWQAQHGNGGMMLLAGDVGYGATASLDCNYATQANAANAPLQIQFNGYVDGSTNGGCWFSFALGNGQNILANDTQANFGILPKTSGEIEVWSGGTLIDLLTNISKLFTLELSDTNSTGSAFNGNGSAAKLYAGATLLGAYQLNQLSGNAGYLTFGADPWNGSWNLAHIDNLQITLPAPILSADLENGQSIIRWPANSGFNIYSSPALGAAANWTLVTNPVPVLDANRNQMQLILVPGVMAQTFFRLEH